MSDVDEIVPSKARQWTDADPAPSITARSESPSRSRSRGTQAETSSRFSPSRSDSFHASHGDRGSRARLRVRRRRRLSPRRPMKDEPWSGLPWAPIGTSRSATASTNVVRPRWKGGLVVRRISIVSRRAMAMSWYPSPSMSVATTSRAPSPSLRCSVPSISRTSVVSPRATTSRDDSALRGITSNARTPTAMVRLTTKRGSASARRPRGFTSACGGRVMSSSCGVNEIRDLGRCCPIRSAARSSAVASDIDPCRRRVWPRRRRGA